MLPHPNFVGRWSGEGQTRRKHNGRLRRLPNRGMLKAKNLRDMRAMDWYFSTQDGFESLVTKFIKYRE